MISTKAIAIAAVVSAIGSVEFAEAQQPAPNNLFTAAGFQVRYADTPEKLAHLDRLPPDKLVTKQFGGKTYYIYAAPASCRCAYVGTPAAYRAYQTGSFNPALPGANGSQFSSGREAPGEQMLDTMTDDDMPTTPGAPSFNDYVFGGMRDD